MINISGCVGQVESPKWLVGMWTYKLTLTLTDSGVSEEMLSPFYYDTKESANEAMKEAMKIADMQARELINSRERLH